MPRAPLSGTSFALLAARPPPPPPASVIDASAYTRQSRTYEPEDPDLRGKRVKPFRLDELQRVPREFRDLHKAMHLLMPEAVFDPGFMDQIRALIQKHTNMDVDLWLNSIRVLKRTQLRATIPGHTCIAVIGLEPTGDKLLLEIDMAFTYRVIDQLLGGHGISIDIHRPLTQIEQGVFSYLLLKALALFQTDMFHGEQVALRLEDIRNDLKSCADIIRHDDFWLCAAWKMNFDLDVGYVRMLLPTSLARRVVPERPPAESALAERIRERIRQRMNRLAGVTVCASIEIGAIELSPNDVDALDPGDIILLDECLVEQLDAHGVSGAARMHIGLGQNGIVHGQLSLQEEGDDAQVVFEVAHIEVINTPSSHDPHEAHGEHANPEEAMAEYEDEGYVEQPYQENCGGPVYALDVQDEDWGIDDQNAGGDEEYGDYEENYEEGGEDGEYAEEYAEGEEGQDYEQAGPAEEVAIDDSDNLAEAEPLLGDIPINVTVELGRVQLTADEVIRLRSGHLMELGRSPADPVDLVVNGKLLAKGELVEIEGSLGVKILSLMKEGE